MTSFRLLAGFCPNMTASMFARLAASGIQTASDFINHDIAKLSVITGIAYSDLITMRQALLAACSADIVNGLTYFESVVSSASIISTGCVELNRILDGGLMTGEITEIRGVDLQITMDIGMRVVAETVMVLQKTVIYVDAINQFDPLKFAGKVSSLDQHNSLQSALSCIRLSNVFDIFDLFNSLASLVEELSDQANAFNPPPKLMVISGVVEMLLPVFSSMTRVDCSGYIAHLAQQLYQLSVEFSVAILLINGPIDSLKVFNKRFYDTPDLVSAWSAVSNTRIEVVNNRLCGSVPTTDSKWKAKTSNMQMLTIAKSKRVKVGQSVDINMANIFCPISTDCS